MKRVVITGVNGFVGRRLAKRLLQSGVEVCGGGRTECMDLELIEFSNFRFMTYDQMAKQDTQYDTFFCLAYEGVNGTTKADWKIQVKNIERTCNTLELAKRLGCKRFVFAGSIDEYEVAKQPDAVFATPTHSWIYASSKFECENFCKAMAHENGIEYIGAMPALIYGEGNATKILPNEMIRKSFLNRLMPLVEGNHYYDMLYIEDAVDALINLASRGKSGESYYVGHREINTFRKTVSDINDILGLNLDLQFGRYEEKAKPIDYADIDRDKMFRDTEYRCSFDFKTGLENTYRWLVEGHL